MRIIKWLERFGRQLLVLLLGAVLGVRRRPITLGARPRILVIRLDERVGNLLLLTPLLTSLRRRFPLATIDVLGQARGELLLGSHPSISGFIHFRKRALLAADGPLCTPIRLRRLRYDVVIDASNPTDPSATQAILARLASARHTIGVLRPGFGRLFTSPVRIEDKTAHEIDLRLELLAPLPGEARCRETSLGPRPDGHCRAAVVELCHRLSNTEAGVVNVGARVPEKRLGAARYAELASLMADRGLVPVLVYGPAECSLARDAAAAEPRALLAPETDLVELWHVLAHARAVISCDTGPMHLAAALGRPTLGIFLCTEPKRYGYCDPPHACVDARDAASYASCKQQVDAWLRSLPPRV